MAPHDRPGCRRHNHVHAAYVNAAIRLIHHLGAKRVETMLLREGVSRDVITRVLFVDSPHRMAGLAPCVFSPWGVRKLPDAVPLERGSPLPP